MKKIIYFPFISNKGNTTCIEYNSINVNYNATKTAIASKARTPKISYDVFSGKS